MKTGKKALNARLHAASEPVAFSALTGRGAGVIRQNRRLNLGYAFKKVTALYLVLTKEKPWNFPLY
jgi:hypothetical protein